MSEQKRKSYFHHFEPVTNNLKNERDYFFNLYNMAQENLIYKTKDRKYPTRQIATVNFLINGPSSVLDIVF